MMHHRPLVSVVIPAYNAERFIERTLNSALRQTYRRLEIIIIDDGSTDATCAIARSLIAGDDRVRIISVPNGGVANARNIGIEAATGPFVAFLDADDLWHPTKVELQVASLTNGPDSDAAAAYARHRVIDVDDRVISTAGVFVCDGYAFARDLYGKFIGNGSTLLVRRETALAVGGFEPSWAARGIGGCEDLDFELKILAKHPIVAIPRFLVGYRVFQGNMSSNKLRMAKAIVATVEHHIRLNPQIPEWAALKARAATCQHALCLLLAERRWNMIAVEFSRLLREDTPRAVEFGAELVARKIRKALRGTRADNAIAVDPPLYSSLSADSLADAALVLPGRRDRKNMERLATLDGVLASRLGIVERRTDQPFRSPLTVELR
jgi:glycosyltransferase involved in cell wall biosynthesis